MKEASDGKQLEDGKQGVYDISPLLELGIYKSLRNPAVFNSVKVESGTVSWSGDIDISPEELYFNCVPVKTYNG